MLNNITTWFSGLPPLLQGVGYLLLLLVILAALGCIICLAENSAASFVREHGVILGLIMLGVMAAVYLGTIFGVTFLLYELLHLPYWLSFVVGLLCGLVGVPTIHIAIVNKRYKP